MSHDLYWTRLFYQRGSGVAKMNGKVVVLARCPMGAESVDFIPEIYLAQIQFKGEGSRDMTAAEIRDANDVLRKLTEAI